MCFSLLEGFLCVQNCAASGGGARVKGLRDEFTQLSNSWFDTPTVWWWRHTALSGSCWWLFSHWLATRCENLSISSWEDPHKPFTPTCNNDRLRPKGLISVEIKSITSPRQRRLGRFGLRRLRGRELEWGEDGGNEQSATQSSSSLWPKGSSRCWGARVQLCGSAVKGGNKAETPRGKGGGGGVGAEVNPPTWPSPTSPHKRN